MNVKNVNRMIIIQIYKTTNAFIKLLKIVQNMMKITNVKSAIQKITILIFNKINVLNIKQKIVENIIININVKSVNRITNYRKN